jgi:hypothetical protein
MGKLLLEHEADYIERRSSSEDSRRFRDGWTLAVSQKWLTFRRKYETQSKFLVDPTRSVVQENASGENVRNSFWQVR